MTDIIFFQKPTYKMSYRRRLVWNSNDTIAHRIMYNTRKQQQQRHHSTQDCCTTRGNNNNNNNNQHTTWILTLLFTANTANSNDSIAHRTIAQHEETTTTTKKNQHTTWIWTPSFTDVDFSSIHKVYNRSHGYCIIWQTLQHGLVQAKVTQYTSICMLRK